MKKKLERSSKEVGEKRTSLDQRTDAQEVYESSNDPLEEGEFLEESQEESKGDSEA